MSEYLTTSGLVAFRPPGSTAALDFSAWSTAQLQTVIDEVEELFELGTGSVLYPSSDTIYVSGDHATFLFLPQHGSYNQPIISLTSVEEVDFDGSVLTTYVEGTDFIHRGHYLYTDVNVEGSLRRAFASQSVWPRGHRNIKLVGSFGLATTPVNVVKAGYTLAIIQTLGLGFSGLINQADFVKKEEKWDDYEVKYAGTTGSQQATKGTANISGYMAIDRVLSKYINYASLFLPMSATVPTQPARNSSLIAQ